MKSFRDQGNHYNILLREVLKDLHVKNHSTKVSKRCYKRYGAVGTQIKNLNVLYFKATTKYCNTDHRR